MGQGLSYAAPPELDLFAAAQLGDLDALRSLLLKHPSYIHRTTLYHRLSPLHLAAANGHVQVLSWILEHFGEPDVFNRHKQTPLMLAAMHGKVSCVQKLLEAGANILMFDALHGRTCLHYAAYYGYSDCLQAILSAAHSTPIVDSWGFARFVNVRDDGGATPLHLAARQRQPNCIQILLDSGGLVCASTGDYGCPGSTPLHLAARGGCLDCVRKLLAWGADRLQIDSSGRIPFTVAMRRKHKACAALLNPSSAEPLVWPSPLKFISELDPEAKMLLEKALMDANGEREKSILKGTVYSLPSPHCSDDTVEDTLDEDTENELCCICFDQVCTIEVQDCGHQMCAHCILALCCHNKPSTNTASPLVPVCPFCRSSIARLVVAKISNDESDKDNPLKLRKARMSRNLSEESSSFKSLSSAMGSFGKMGGRGSGRISDSNSLVDKP